MKGEKTCRPTFLTKSGGKKFAAGGHGIDIPEENTRNSKQNTRMTEEKIAILLVNRDKIFAFAPKEQRRRGRGDLPETKHKRKIMLGGVLWQRSILSVMAMATALK